MNEMPKISLSLIKEKRLELEFTLQDMANKLDFKNASTYYKYETGSYIFKANHVPQIAAVLGCQMSDLFTIDEEFERKGRMMHEKS